MKFKIVKKDKAVIIILSDGSVTIWEPKEDFILMEHYVGKITENTTEDTIEEELSGYGFANEYPLDTPFSTLLEEALDFMIVKFDTITLDETIFPNFG